MKVLLAASECAPIVKVGGLGDVVGALPKELARLGVETAVIIPKYKVEGFGYPQTLPGTKVPVFYIENDAYFSGPSVYPGGEKEYERFVFFSRAVVDFLDARVFEPDVIHCHDYHTGLIPDILKEQRKKVATVLTIHDLSNKGISPPGILETALLSSSSLRLLDWDLADRNVSLLLQGIVGADVVNTVSPTYAAEILTTERGEGFDDVLRARQARVFGVLNGLDTGEFDPTADKNLVRLFPKLPSSRSKNSSPDDYLSKVLAAKKANKVALQKKLGLEEDASRPLISLISRLVERKGIGLLVQLLQDTDFREAEFVVLGKGERHFEDELARIASQNSGRIGVQIHFDEPLARLIYAASDIFLVPSLFEPCGLTQMVAMRYGSVPVVRDVGGLSDTIEEGVTGFKFGPFNYADFKKAARAALTEFEKGTLSRLMTNGLKKDFSWEMSARKYVRLYEKALEYKFGIARGTGGEIRRDLFGDWTILSPVRSQRPEDAGPKKIPNSKLQITNSGTHSAKEEIEDCPFEEGHEFMSPGEVFRTGTGVKDQRGWLTRVVPNKYPILPAHEVIIHSTDHDKEPESFDQTEMENLIWTYLSRYRHYENFGYVHLFCNRGKAAAASLKHPHSQLIVLDEMSQATLYALQSAEDFYRSYGLCSYCSLIRREAHGPRFVWENESFVVLTPFSSDWPFEIMIVPKTHRKSFGNISDLEMKHFSQVLQVVIKALTGEVTDISYNYWIHSLPDFLGLKKTSLYYHWHLDLVPRLKTLGGVELGLKLMIDDRISPEDAAARLRSHLSPSA